MGQNSPIEVMHSQRRMRVPPTDPEDLARLKEVEGKAAKIHAAAHAPTGSDPLTPAAIGAAPASAFNYSTTEAATGFTWINGRAIYKKTIDCGALPNATVTSKAHGIISLDEIVRWEATATNAARSEHLLLPHAGAYVDGSYNVQVKMASGNIQISTSNNLSTFTVCRVTLYYTKSV